MDASRPLLGAARSPATSTISRATAFGLFLANAEGSPAMARADAARVVGAIAALGSSTSGT